MKYLLNLSLLATLLLHAVAATATSVDALTQLCRSNAADMQSLIESDRDTPDPVKRFTKLFSNPKVCACVSQGLAKSGQKIFPESQATLIRYVKLQSVCTAEDINQNFTAQCEGLYRDLLPLMGYHTDDPQKLAEMCSCATTVVRKTITPEALYNVSMRGTRRYQALANDRKNGTHTAQQINSEPHPMATGMQQLRTCVDSTLGAPTWE